MLKLVFSIISLLISVNSFSTVDPLNTYQWNKKNFLSQNSKVSTTPWYEWWYYKVVIPETNESFYFVYGVVNPWDKEATLGGTRAYVEMGDFNSRKTFEQIIPVEDFKASYKKTHVEVGESIATDKKIVGNIKQHGNSVSWDIDIKHEWSFNATSWASGRNITNIEWYPAQASAKCTGVVESEGKLYKFTDAPCYQDRNWGKSFPRWWTWIVSNHFKGNQATTLAIGGGAPKFFDRYEIMEGVAIGLNHEGREYAFRPNEFAKVKVNISFGTWEIEASNGGFKVEIVASAPRENFMDLQFATPTGEIFHDYEALIGQVNVKLYSRVFPFQNKWKLKEVLLSEHAGIEYGSKDIYDLDKLFDSEKTLYNSYLIKN